MVLRGNCQFLLLRLSRSARNAAGEEAGLSNSTSTFLAQRRSTSARLPSSLKLRRDESARQETSKTAPAGKKAKVRNQRQNHWPNGAAAKRTTQILAFRPNERERLSQIAVDLKRWRKYKGAVGFFRLKSRQRTGLVMSLRLQEAAPFD